MVSVRYWCALFVLYVSGLELSEAEAIFIIEQHGYLVLNDRGG